MSSQSDMDDFDKESDERNRIDIIDDKKFDDRYQKG